MSQLADAPFAEAGIISAAMLDPQVAIDAVATVQDDWFRNDKNRIAWGAVKRIVSRGAVLDAVTLVEELRGTGELEAAGGLQHMSTLLDAAITSAAWESYAATLADRAHRYRLSVAMSKGRELLAGSDSAADVQTEVERLVLEADTARAGSAPTTFAPDIDEFLEELEAYGSEEALVGAQSGIEALDEFVGPLEPGSLTYLAARPSMGKSALMLRYALNTAIRQRKPVVVFSVESPRQEVRRRVLAQEARINMKVARQRGLQEDELFRMGQVIGLIQRAPLYVLYRPGLTVGQMRRELRQISRDPEVKAAGGIALIAVDYLQLMAEPGAESRRHEVEAISRGLKAVAGEFDTAMLALSQLSRAVEQVPDKRPALSHLRESGMIEADADTVLLLYRPEYYFGAVGKDGTSLVGVAEAKVAKARDGATGPVAMHFEAPFTLFEDRHRHGSRP